MMTKNIEKWTGAPNIHQISELLKTPRAIVAWSQDYPAGQVIGRHSHERAQLLYASMGLMTVTTAEGIWVVPPLRGVWIPENKDHQISCSGKVLMRTLYIETGKLSSAPEGCAVVSVSPLLRELILHAVSMPRLYDEQGSDGRIAHVILDCIERLETAPLALPAPTDRRLLAIQEALLKEPADQQTRSEWAASVGLTSRTLVRYIESELNLTFGQWRQQIRLLEALRRLGDKQAVTRVAIDLGYDSPSAFIAMFKKNLGCTPGQYFKDVS